MGVTSNVDVMVHRHPVGPYTPEPDLIRRTHEIWNGFALEMHAEAMVWHNLDLDDMVHVLEDAAEKDMIIALVWEDGIPKCFGTLRKMLSPNIQNPEANWNRTLPPLSDILSQRWPCIADIFCAHGHAVSHASRSRSQRVRPYMG